jgi:HD-GYP domain-containing protein (c-di-GMP phosphodiesterase class II)
MTQTLEEAPIVEQALGVLHSAARATSAALHVETPAGPRIAAAAGQWHTERVWAPATPVDGPEVTRRGRREVLRLPRAARGHRIGTVTLVRPDAQPFDPHGIDLLRLLVDQMTVAVQNARDYREKLEQAIRDPLTGLYNRRFLLEALEKEVQRSERLWLGRVARHLRRRRLQAHQRPPRPRDGRRRAAPHRRGRRLGHPAGRQLRAHRRRGVRAAAARDGPARGAARRRPRAHRRRPSGHPPRPARHPERRRRVDARRRARRPRLQRRADSALYWAKRNGKDLCAVASEAIGEPGGDVHDGVLAHLYALVAMIDAQQLHTRDHSENVAAYAVALAQALGLQRDRIVKLRRAAMLHDVGKVAVRSDVLAKAGPLTDAEYEEILAHPVVGGVMLAHAGLQDEAAWVRHHHERVDGHGYPDRLRDTDLPVEARILFVADAFEAMTSDRPYRSGLSVADAVAELRRCAGTQFDPVVVEALVELLDSGRLMLLALRSE